MGERLPISNNEIRDLVGDIKLSSELATRTLNDLINYDKVRSNRMKLEFHPSNALTFIKDSLKPFHVQARAEKIAIRSNFQGFNADSLTIMIDRVKMEQVFRNFISNALKFSSSGSSIEIDVTVQKEFSFPPKLQGIAPKGVAGVFRVAVIDQGPGISLVSN